MPIDLYCVEGGAPSRNVFLAAKAVGVELNFKNVDLMNGEQFSPEFIKLNPQHTVPTLDDNGFVLWESKAIMVYLVEQYGKDDDSLYPKDPKKKGLVNQRLYFDMGTMYASFAEYYYPVLFGGAKEHDPAKLESIREAFKLLDQFLSNGDYVAGDNLTLADLSLVATVSTFEIMDYDFSSYKNVARWFEKVKANAPYYEEANAKPLQQFKALVERLTKQ